MQVSFDIPTRVAAILTLRSIQQASITELRLRKEGLKQIEFTKDELKDLNIQVFPNGQYNWNTEKQDDLTNLEISEGVKELICAQLDTFASRKDADGKPTFPIDLLPLADYFSIQDPESAVPAQEDPKV